MKSSTFAQVTMSAVYTNQTW